MKKTLTTLVSVLSVLVGCAGEETTDPPASCTTSAGGHDAGPLTVVTMDVAVVTDSGTGGEGGASACETIPPEQACAGKCSAFAPIGCGLTIPCDPHCGDTSGTMTCGSDGDCQCAHASFLACPLRSQSPRLCQKCPMLSQPPVSACGFSPSRSSGNGASLRCPASRCAACGRTTPARIVCGGLGVFGRHFHG